MIGNGISGRDIIQHLLKTVRRVTLSRHKPRNKTQTELMQLQSLHSDKLTIKDDVVSFTSNGANFIDGSYQTFDAVIFTTGILLISLN